MRKYKREAAYTSGKIGKSLLTMAKVYTSNLRLPIACFYNRDSETWDLQPMDGPNKDKMIYVYPSPWENKIEIYEVWFGDYSQETLLKTFKHDVWLGCVVDFIFKQFNW